MAVTNTFTAGTTIRSADVNTNFSELDTRITVADNFLDDGWVDPSETWTYASATTITVPTGAASKYAVGDKIKLTQTTVKYFYVTAVADTLLTVTAGTDYTVANAAITSPYYSKVESPVGHPIWFADTPTVSGLTSPNYSVQQGRLAIRGRFVTYRYYVALGTWAGQSGAITINAPLNCSASVPEPVGIGSYYRDVGSGEDGAVVIYMNLGTNDIILLNSTAAGPINWEASTASTAFRGEISYEL